MTTTCTSVLDEAGQKRFLHPHELHAVRVRLRISHTHTHTHTHTHFPSLSLSLSLSLEAAFMLLVKNAFSTRMNCMLQEYVFGFQKHCQPWVIEAVPDPRAEGGRTCLRSGLATTYHP